MKVKQISVSNGKFQSIFWIENSEKLKKGSYVKPKGFKDFWKIEKVWNCELEHKEINRSWHVGGL